MIAWLSLDAIWGWLTSWAALSTLIGCAAVAAAVFSENIIVKFAIPDLRKWAVVVAFCAFASSSLLTKGYINGLAVKQAEWDSAVLRERDDGNAARSKADRTVGDFPADRRVLRNDPFNRNSGTEPDCK